MYEASAEKAEKDDSSQGNSAANAADPTSGLHGNSCRSHKDSFAKAC